MLQDQLNILRDAIDFLENDIKTLDDEAFNFKRGYIEHIMELFNVPKEIIHWFWDTAGSNRHRE